MLKIFKIAAVALAFGLAGQAQAACERQVVPGASRSLPAGGIDVQLLDRAILAEANYRRCLQNRPPLRARGELRAPARAHSLWMARAQRVSHQSTVAGRRTLADRVRSTGVVARNGSENLARLPLYDLTPRFRVVDARTCKFADPKGRRVGTHTYASFAHKVVSLWMKSPGHRRNLLSRDTTHVAHAAVVKPGANYCGDVYVTQIFIG